MSRLATIFEKTDYGLYGKGVCTPVNFENIEVLIYARDRKELDRYLERHNVLLAYDELKAYGNCEVKITKLEAEQ